MTASRTEGRAAIDGGTGKARTLVVDNLSGCVHGPSLRENIDCEARLMTNEAGDHVRLGNDRTTH